LWPLVLVAIGLSIILARTGLAQVGTVAAALVVGFAAGALIAVGPGSVPCGGSEPARLTQTQGEFKAEAKEAEVNLQFDCGTLDARMTDNAASWTVASGSGDAQPRIDPGWSSLSVSDHAGQWWGAGRQHWVVALPTGKNYRLLVESNAAETNLDLRGGRFGLLTLHPNAGSLRLDLRGASVNDLDLALNAGSASIFVGSGSGMSGSLHVNAGSIELCTNGPLTMSFRLTDNITFSTNLDSSGLVRLGNSWSTPGAISGIRPYQVELTIDGNAGSFTLNPEGGCA
jgi:hypothetical protein